MTDLTRKPLDEKEVIVHVEKGMAANIKIVEADSKTLPNEITVQVSKKRKASAIPVLGVIVK